MWATGGPYGGPLLNLRDLNNWLGVVRSRFPACLTTGGTVDDVLRQQLQRSRPKRAEEVDIDQLLPKLKGLFSPDRPRIGLTIGEYAEAHARATAEGRTVAEWCREIVRAELEREP